MIYTMTVKELIEKLSKLNSNAQVYFYDTFDYVTKNISGIAVHKNNKEIFLTEDIDETVKYNKDCDIV